MTALHTKFYEMMAHIIKGLTFVMRFVPFLNSNNSKNSKGSATSEPRVVKDD
jgi:hypothetical protein